MLGFATRIQQHTVESEENSNPKFRELIREGLVGKVWQVIKYSNSLCNEMAVRDHVFQFGICAL